MTIIAGLLVFIFVIFLYSLIVFILHKKNLLEKHGISFYGPALLLRTKKGRGLLKKIASKKRFWKSYGNFAIVFCFIAMVLMTTVLIWQAWAVLGFTPAQKAAMPGPEIALVLPGINPILPIEYIGYIIFALIIAIIVHEFSHGILTFAGELKVKSLGILYLIVPVGAFVEPDEEELKKTVTPKRMRVFAAGPLANFVIVLISIMLFSFVFMSSVQPIQLVEEGIGVLEVYAGSPAETMGIKTGSVILSLNETNFSGYNSFEDRYFSYLNTTSKINANDTVNISFYTDGTFYLNKKITFDDRYNYTNNISHIGKGYSGIYSFINIEEHLNVLSNPITESFPYGFLFFYVMPLTGYFEGYNPIVAPFINNYEITGPLNVLPADLFWIIVNALYWIFWLNLAVGLFNVLPMIPLDGGFLFNDAVGSFVKKIKKSITDEKKEKIAKNVSTVISLIILIAIILPFIIKYI
jgi:membrane-associated protease RseP (regulator of RpoE activity)